MKTLTEPLAQYADYHRDPRNILTHFIGIPMIVLAVQVLLSRPAWPLGAFVLTPALLVTLPVLVLTLVIQKEIVGGLTAGGVKGG